MVEFSYNLKELLENPITAVGPTLLPENFCCNNAQQRSLALLRISEIIDRLGDLSATAQHLRTPITTAKKLKQSENQTVYIFADSSAGKKGQVFGILKVATKNLYLYDKSQNVRKMLDVPCILDFYIHESQQRSGKGKQLFDNMLEKQKWTPAKCVLDLPSKEMLEFFKKHYSLQRKIPQRYNLTLFEEFFDEVKKEETTEVQRNNAGEPNRN